VTRLTLVLGGARSGKSRYAEALFEGVAAPVYVATGQPLDEEMRNRIAHHRAARGPHWHTVEEPIELAATLLRHRDRPVLVDCLTLWLGNLMAAERDVEAEGEALLRALAELEGPAVLVSNEVGMGIVPDNRLARDFRDHAGRLHQRVAALSDRVAFIAAGLPLILKGL
jgi:adenosylcobinamide kinase/adenosylcobinamide-phosphate guanylyltransferase